MEITTSFYLRMTVCAHVCTYLCMLLCTHVYTQVSSEQMRLLHWRGALYFLLSAGLKTFPAFWFWSRVILFVRGSSPLCRHTSAAPLHRVNRELQSNDKNDCFFSLPKIQRSMPVDYDSVPGNASHKNKVLRCGHLKDLATV